MSPGHIQITVKEFYGKNCARQIYCNLEQLTAGMTVKKAVRTMLAKAAEQFQERAPRGRRE